MAWNSLITAIEAVITANANGEITGQILQDLLKNNIVPVLGKDRFLGIATPATNAGAVENECYYFAFDGGVYANLGGVTKNIGLHFFYYKGGVWNNVTFFELGQDADNLESSTKLFAGGKVFAKIKTEITNAIILSINENEEITDLQRGSNGLIIESHTASTIATGTSGSYFTKTYSLVDDLYISNIVTNVSAKYIEYLNDADDVLFSFVGYGKTFTNKVIPKLTGATKVKLYSQSNTIAVKVLQKINNRIVKDFERVNKVAQILKEIGTESVPKTSEEIVGSVYKFRFPYTFNTIIDYAFVTSSSGIWIEVFNTSNTVIDQIRPITGQSYVENYLLPNYATALNASYFKICIPAANYNNGITVSKAKLIVTEDKLNKTVQEKLGTGVFKSTSTFGILGNGQGMLETEAKSAFKFLTAKETDLYIFDVYWNATTPFYLTLKRVSDDTTFGTIQKIDPLSTEYKLYPIITSGYSLGYRGVIGYASIKGSEFKRLQTGIFSSKPIFSIDTSIFERMQNQVNKLILLWGDSLTAIGSGYGDYFIINQNKYLASAFGSGGETTLQIGGRMGTIPLKIGVDFTIPATTDPVSINLKSTWNNSTCFPRANYGMNPVHINGVKGNIDITSAGVSATFTREIAGDALNVKTNTILISNATNYYDDTLQVVFVGQNGGFSDEADNLAQWEAFTRPLKRYIVITPHINTTDTLENEMRKKYGSLYYNLRHWCVNYGLTEAGITPTTADTDAIALGDCPPSLLSDGIHFIESVREIMAENIWKKLIELGYVVL